AAYRPSVLAGRQPLNRSIMYSFFTSGSTGRPKGVLIIRENFKLRYSWYSRLFLSNQNERVSQVISPTFDPFGLDAWPTLSSGKTLCVAPEESRYSVPALFDWLETQCITVLVLPAPMAEEFIKEAGLRVPKSLRLVGSGGE